MLDQLDHLLTGSGSRLLTTLTSLRRKEARGRVEYEKNRNHSSISAL